MSRTQPVIVWFRQDLRLADNNAFREAAETGVPVLPVYVLDDEGAGEWAMGAASRWWLHESLAALNADLEGGLYCLQGCAEALIPRLASQVDASGIFWNRCYEPWRIEQDSVVDACLSADGLDVSVSGGSLLFEPDQVMKSDGSPYKVFTPYYRKGCLAAGRSPAAPVARPARFDLYRMPSGGSPDDLGLLPELHWYEEMAETWRPGEQGAGQRLNRFLQEGIRGYKDGRNRPDQEFVSRLSPHLHFGEISPGQIWFEARALEHEAGTAVDVDHFLSELGWREFSHYLLYHWPELPQENLQQKFDRFPWRDDPDALERWQRGQTGYPIVDAGMRQLWRTGYMHNRVRMIVGSFLVKNLLLHWHHGEKWFWDTLVDADLANNSASWQWIAGCGADAAPFFRIFNPVTQGQKFDPGGAYVRKYVPEIGRLPEKFIHQPWHAPEAVLAEADVRLGVDYPHPMVDLRTSRERALQAFKSL